MSKTLIIKGADFSANKVATVSFNAIECEGITLNKNTINISDIESSESIIATVMPSDCTQPVIWSSLNTSVATVVNGVIIPISNGTTTITARCGSFSASCVVTVALVKTYRFNWIMGKLLSRQSGSPMLSEGDLTKGAVGIGTEATVFRAYDAVTKTENTHYYNKIPVGATKIKVTAPSEDKITFVWCDSSNHSSLGTQMILAVNYDDTSAWNAGVPNGNREITIPSGCDSFYICDYCPSGLLTAESMPTRIVVTAF